ncbi:MAG: hypothetical protein JXR76_05390 [Deltaproteobacteria bacterium]|nr:hypothetical protein [Deltaproteobacteria bacterium]
MATQLLESDIPDSSKIIVLVTDGLPDTCADPSAQDPVAAQNASVAAVAAAYINGITTYIISVDWEGESAHFQALADAGQNTANATYYEAFSQTELKLALEEVIEMARVRPCELEFTASVSENDAAGCDVRFSYSNGSPDSVFAFGDPDGWTATTVNESMRLSFTGEACRTLKNDIGQLVVKCPCGAFGIDMN